MDEIQDLLHQGTWLHRQGRIDQASTLYLDILRRHPGHADALHLLGIASSQKGNHRAAIELIQQAIRSAPRNAAYYSSLGNCQQRIGQPAAAIESFNKAIDLDPQNAEAHLNRGNAHLSLRDFDEAIADYDRAIELEPSLAEAYGNRGFALQEQNRFDASLASFDKAIALNPRFALAYTNRGYVKQRMHRFDAAIEDYDRAISINPGDVEAHWNKALALLIDGRFEEGWKLYEWRWRRSHNSIRQFSSPRWTGTEPLAGKTILLHAEQGFGDTIQFCRYAKLVAGRGAHVIMEAPKSLLPLLRGLDGVHEWIERGEALPQFDYHCPLLSLPLAFGTRLETIPAADAYLHPDAGKNAKWLTRLGEPKSLRVGITWSGNRSHQNDVQRSMALAEFVRELRTDCEYVSLQREVSESDRTVLQRHPAIRHFGDELADFSDTAALCSLCDVVVSVDTSAAHVAAAIGRKTWVLLPFHPDWRWLIGRPDSPWYPTATLYRQRTAGDWESVLSRINSDLGLLRDRLGWG